MERREKREKIWLETALSGGFLHFCGAERYFSSRPPATAFTVGTERLLRCLTIIIVLPICFLAGVSQ